MILAQETKKNQEATYLWTGNTNLISKLILGDGVLTFMFQSKIELNFTSFYKQWEQSISSGDYWRGSRSLPHFISVHPKSFS